MRSILACVGVLLACTACATTEPSPVTADYRDSFRVVALSAALEDGREIPDRYDTSVNELMQNPAIVSSRQATDFQAFADTRGGLTPTNSGELFLEFLIQTELDLLVTPHYRGERPAELELTITSTTFPNAATMMLVGEMIGISYEYTLSDLETESPLVRTMQPVSPFVDRSAGAGGGLLGLALRSGEDRHILDLQNMADAVVADVTNTLRGDPIAKGRSRRIAILPIADRPAGNPATMDDVVAD